MDSSAMAAGIVPLLAIYLGHLGEQAAHQLGEALGDAAVAKLRRLVDLVKAKVTGKPEAQASLELLRQRPDDPRARSQLAAQLEVLAAADEGFAGELRRLADQARQAGGPTLTQIIDAGAVAIQGNVIQQGTYNAARDLHIG